VSALVQARLPHKLVVEVSRRLGGLRQEYFASRVRSPYFIVGCGRSGTTMLNDLFDHHPSVANYPTEANELWHPRMYPWHESTVETPPFFVDAKQFTERSLAQRTPTDDLRLRATFGAYQTLARRPVFLQKTVMVSFMLDKILELFPDARFVQLVRDGRSVALSWVVKERAKLKQPRYSRYSFDEAELLAVYAKHWQDNILAMDDAVARLGLAARYHELRYEDLCANPTGELTSLARFLDVAPEPFLGERSAHIKTTNEKARAIDPAHLAIIDDVAREARRRKGYA
jgi:hypothetical protein